MPRFSPLCIRDGFACGWVRAGSPQPHPVRLYVDGRVLATEMTGAVLQPAAIEACGPQPPDAAGYVIALPGEVLDGFPHDIHVSCLPRGGEEIHGRTVSFRSSSVCGEVRQQGRNFVGTVWFDALPAAAGELQVLDERGRVRLAVPLEVSPSPDRFGFPAHFSVRCESVRSPAALHFRCAGVELRGSPCSSGEALLGRVEELDDTSIRGWAFDAADLRKPMELVLRVDGRPEQWFRPNIVRTDIAERLKQGETHHGLVGFDIPAPAVLRDGESHFVEVASAATGRLLTQGQQTVQFARHWVDLAQGPAAVGRGSPPNPPAPAAPLVSIVVLNRNGAPLLEALFDSWARHNTVPCEIILIDHASTDRSLDVARQWQDRLSIRTVALQENRSFSESCNRGAQMARGEFLLFLNNDIVWLHDALPTMLAELQQGDDVGIVGLKLLKVVGEGRRQDRHSSQVQHLGVRFKLNQLGYWPFEVQPSSEHGESEYGPQDVPAVTGAVLLCRKVDFDAAGQFDTAYFYGFEDVEFCLRLAYRLRRKVVCRNDCVALHHHGHTRLSGRERSIFQRLEHNATVLEAQVGVWAKQAYWQSLVRGDGYVTREPLTIGLVAANGTLRTARGRDRMREFGRRLASATPRSRVVLLEPHRNWKDVADLHVLLVAEPGYDVRTVLRARPDLIIAAWMASDPAEWAGVPWLQAFDAWLAPGTLAARMGRRTGLPVQAADLASPLAGLLGIGRWRLRTAIRAGKGVLGDEAQELLVRLRGEGLPCWIEPRPDDARPRMADVCITILHSAQDAPAEPMPSGVLNVAWTVDGADASAGGAGSAPDAIIRTSQAPTSAWLHQLMESHIGRAFRPS